MTDSLDLGIDGLEQVRPLDSGGFSDVYEARDEFGRRVAVKVLNALDEAGRRRFDRERSVMGMVAGHPHIVNPFTSGYTADTGRPYVVMEYLGGGSLQQRLDRLGPMPVAEAASIIEPIVDALGASHRAGIIHKDVKPANILLTADGTPKLADFGIASVRDADTTTALAYSPAYTPPETFHADAGSDLRDERSDLYSLAATLFALVVGQGPFLTGTGSPASAMVRILNNPPPPTGHPAIDQFLTVAMAKDPDHRYQDADSFAAALRSAATGGAMPSSGPVTQVAPPQWAPPGSSPEPAPAAVPAPAGWDGRPSAPVSAGYPVDGHPGQPPLPANHFVDEPSAANNRAVWLTVGAALAALIVAMGTFAIVSRGDDSAGDGELTDAGGEEAAPTTEQPTTSQPPSTTAIDPVDLAGTQVTITGVEGDEASLAGLEGAFEALTEETGIEITYQRAFNDDLEDMIAEGRAPDITMFAQPIVLADFARSDQLTPVPPDIASDVSLVWNGEWTQLANVDGVQYGIPVKSDLKSLVWYKPGRFAELGYEVPTTWSEMVALTERAVADGNTPWCVGIESGAATGWVFTDWVEDLVLRRHGVEVYDQWVEGQVRFTDPRIVATFQEVRDLWTLPGATHADSGSILDTAFGDNGPPLANDDCLMHRQAAFFSAFIPAGTPFADGTADAVDVFYLPSEDRNQPILGGGAWAAALADRPEVWVVMQYLGSAEYANARQAAQVAVTGNTAPSGFLTAVDGVDRNLFTPLENSMLDVLAVASPVRFDASDSMPGQVGAGTFWSQGSLFVDGQIDAATAAAAIDDSWPG